MESLGGRRKMRDKTTTSYNVSSAWVEIALPRFGYLPPEMLEKSDLAG